MTYFFRFNETILCFLRTYIVKEERNMSTQETLEEFEKIYQKTYDITLKYVICKCSNLEDVNDIIQEIYIELYKTLKNEKEIKDINAFIHGIAKNKIRKHFYIKNKFKIISIFQEKNDENTMIDIDSKIDIEAQIIRRDNIEAIWKYIIKRNILTGKIFYLYFVLEMSFKEIAEELEIKESTAKTKLYRMLKDIKKNFGGGQE